MIYDLKNYTPFIKTYLLTLDKNVYKIKKCFRNHKTWQRKKDMKDETRHDSKNAENHT